MLCDLLISSEDTLSAPDAPALDPASGLGGEGAEAGLCTQFRPFPNWRVCGNAGFPIEPHPPGKLFPLLEIFLLLQRAFIQ